jgi:hypothetical protein
MPYKKRIPDLELTIDETLAQLSKFRADGAGKGVPKATAKVEGLLARLARLKARRIELIDKQGPISN